METKEYFAKVMQDFNQKVERLFSKKHASLVDFKNRYV